METVEQNLAEILESLSPLQVDWQDETAHRVVAKLQSFPMKPHYTEEDVALLLNAGFGEGILICRLFLGLSKDAFEGVLRAALGTGGTGVKRFRENPNGFVAALAGLGLLEKMREEVNRKPSWNDVLIERLRSGRGSAISGQKRGRDVEDFVESIVRRVFGDRYDTRCSFIGARQTAAKCDFAIPSKEAPRIIIESKGYGATGSKMTDIIGDIERIITAKRHDMAFVFFTDGLTWGQRTSDLRKIIGYQNNGEILRIYTRQLAQQFEADLRLLKQEHRI